MPEFVPLLNAQPADLLACRAMSTVRLGTANQSRGSSERGDPVALGLVASLSHPGGNLTGVSTLGVELERKRLELLHGVVPSARTFAALIRSANPAAEQQEKELLAAAAVFGVNLQIFDAENERDFDVVVAKIAELKAGGLVIATDGLFII
jgi:ABC-type uncharacterized transport system substrate-binding protein